MTALHSEVYIVNRHDSKLNGQPVAVLVGSTNGVVEVITMDNERTWVEEEWLDKRIDALGVIYRHGGDDNLFTCLMYWDCDCEDNYIRNRMLDDTVCDKCGFTCCGWEDNTGPDSRVNEVLKMLHKKESNKNENHK